MRGSQMTVALDQKHRVYEWRKHGAASVLCCSDVSVQNELCLDVNRNTASEVRYEF